MFKLLKYEFRRNLIIIGILYSMIAILEVYALFSMLTTNEGNTALSFIFLSFGAFAGILMIFIMAIQSYSRELHSKYSYLTFMTPNSTYTIIGAKLINTLIVALVTTVIAVILIIVDYQVLINQFPVFGSAEDVLSEIANRLGYNLNETLWGIFATFILLWFDLFTYICVAYLAITLSATALSNKRGHGFISFVLFIVIILILNRLTSYLPAVDIGSGMLNTLLAPLCTYIADALFMVLAFIGCGMLLDKKVDL